MKTRSMYKAERTSLDRISTLPQPVLETILCLLPTKEAARTSILSREWRYKWTKIPRLHFSLEKITSELTSDIASTRRNMDMDDVYRILLRHQGPIHEFTLFMEDYWEQYECFELEQIILHLSRNHTVKELTIDGDDGSEDMWYKLPTSVFALHQLVVLHLSLIEIDHPSIFNGFGSLGTLYLSSVKIATQTLLHILSNCPSLKNLTLGIWESDDKCTVNELLKCLPVVEHLTISGNISEWLVLDSAPTSLIHLKYLRLDGMCVADRFGLAFLLVLIKCSPNLETMGLEMDYGLDFSAVKDKYSDVWLEHLNKVHIYFGSNELETEFVKFILARSPKLKEVGILTVVDPNRESEMIEALSQVQCASPVVNVTTDSMYGHFANVSSVI